MKIKEKEIFLSLVEFLGVKQGEKKRITAEDAMAYMDLSIYSASLPFVCVLEGEVLEFRFGRAPMGLLSLLEKRSPIANKQEVVFSGKKMPEMTLKVVL